MLAMFVTFATGTYSRAPADVLATVAVRATERLLGIITPWAPTASAVLKTAPKLCGSVIPSSTIIKGSWPYDFALSIMSSTET